MSQRFALSPEADSCPLNSAAARWRLEVVTDTGGPSLTRQEFADDADINVLMQRYEKVGTWPLPPVDKPPMYIDFVGMPDLREAMDQMNMAQEAFMTLPAKVRREFDNDPRAFVEFAQDAANLPKMKEWGLAAAEKVPDPPMRVEVVNPTPAPDSASAGAAGA